MPMVVDLSELPMGVRKKMHEILSRENEMEIVNADIRQRQIAKFYHDHPPASMNGLGGMTMAMDPYWVNYWRHVLKYDPAEEADVRKWLRKKYDWFRVKHTGTKTLVGFTGGLVGKGKRVKSYNLSKTA